MISSPRRRVPLAVAALLVACNGDDTATTGSTSATSTATTEATGSTAGSSSSGGTTAGTSSSGSATGTASETSTASGTSTSTGTSTGPGTTTDTSGTGTSAGTTDSTGVVTGTSGSSSTGEPPCLKGTILCENGVAKVCDGMGGFESEDTCAKVCAPDLGCVECIPGDGVCNGDMASLCDDQGGGYVDTFCDGVQGVSCDAGKCVGACSPDNLGTSYIGCDYYSLVSPNVVGNNFTFAVVVSNVSAQAANITVTKGAVMVKTDMVPAKSVKVVSLPWVTELKGGGASKIVVDGAYRIRSTQPVTLYQYSPLEYQLGGQFTYTNDASLLMPTNVWGLDTVAIARNTLNGLPGIYEVVARYDNTKVTVVPSATGGIINAGGGIAANGTGMVTLNEGDVLQVNSAAGGGEPNMPDKSDITGTRVKSDKPVMVLGAHNCTYIPWNSCCCDHLEELNLPVDNLAKEYIVTTPFVKAPMENPKIKARMVRMVATTDGTTLSYDPPQAGAPTMLAKAGDYAEINTDKDFKVTANFKIAVSEYLLSQQAGGNTGDPAMTISVPIEQYRIDYSFHAPTNYESNFVNITAPVGAQVTLDGQAVAGFTPIGGTGFAIARVQLSNAGDGNHTLSGNQAFGVQVYGYGQYTSYWYPGGLDLKLIPQ